MLAEPPYRLTPSDRADRHTKRLLDTILFTAEEANLHDLPLPEGSVVMLTTLAAREEVEIPGILLWGEKERRDGRNRRRVATAAVDLVFEIQAVVHGRRAGRVWRHMMIETLKGEEEGDERMVRVKRRRLGRELRHWTAEEDRMVEEARVEGKGVKEIAQQLKRSEGAVYERMATLRRRKAGIGEDAGCVVFGPEEPHA